MKKFKFSLDRVLEWRRLQTRLEESRLETLYATLAQLTGAVATLEHERDRAGSGLLANGSATGLELAFLEAFRSTTAIEIGHLAAKRAECRRQIDAQMGVVSEKRRDLRLLEKLREQRRHTWQADLDREIDQQAGEAYLAKWGTVRSMRAGRA